jgi:hypothetical protein
MHDGPVILGQLHEFVQYLLGLPTSKASKWLILERIKRHLNLRQSFRFPFQALDLHC